MEKADPGEMTVAEAYGLIRARVENSKNDNPARFQAEIDAGRFLREGAINERCMKRRRGLEQGRKATTFDIDKDVKLRGEEIQRLLEILKPL